MILNGRLRAIADMVPRGSRVADIGTDHGYIPAYLVTEGIIKWAVAADISKGSLSKAEALVLDCKLDGQIIPRLGGGLTVLKPGEVDTIILAGMGGLLIRDILEDSQEVARSCHTLILQPMVAQENLRRWLTANDYRIVDESLVKEDRRIYEIIRAQVGHETVVREVYYEVGLRLIEKQHPLLEEFVLQKIKTLEEILSRVAQGNAQTTINRSQELRRKLRQLKEVYRWEVESKTL